MLQDWEAMQQCINGNTKELARELGYRGDNFYSVYRWQEPYGGPNDCGVRGPLGTVEKIILFSLRKETPEDKALAPLHFLCRQFNRVDVPVGDSPKSVKELTGDFLLMQKEAADVTKHFVEKIADGHVSPCDAKVMEKEIWDLVQKALTLNKKIQESVK